MSDGDLNRALRATAHPFTAEELAEYERRFLDDELADVDLDALWPFTQEPEQ